MKDGSLNNGESVNLNALICIGVSCQSVTKVEILKGSIKGIHRVISCKLTGNKFEISTEAQIGCEAMGMAIKDLNITCHHDIPLAELNHKDMSRLSTAY